MSDIKNFRLDDQRGRSKRQFRHQPSADEIEVLKRDYNLLGLKKAQLVVEIEPKGRGDWQLQGRLSATVVQPCVVTLEPVTTRIDASVDRLYVVEMPEPEGDEVEIPDDDRVEPRPAVLDLAALFAEVLALELPEWPRAKGAELPPGLVDDDERPNPFAALEALKTQIKPE